MSHARITQCGQETWFRNVERISSNGHYLTLELSAHPSRVNFWLPMTRVLLCADGPEVTAALREENA